MSFTILPEISNPATKYIWFYPQSFLLFKNNSLYLWVFLVKFPFNYFVSVIFSMSFSFCPQPDKVKFQLRLGQSKAIYSAFKAIQDSSSFQTLTEAQKRIVEGNGDVLLFHFIILENKVEQTKFLIIFFSYSSLYCKSSAFFFLFFSKHSKVCSLLAHIFVSLVLHSA